MTNSQLTAHGPPSRGLGTHMLLCHHQCGLQAMELWQSRGHGESSCTSLADQMYQYRQGSPPFNAPFAEPFDLRRWWQCRNVAGAEEIAGLGLLLGAVVPHAAEPERLFSAAGQNQSKLRNGLSVHVNMMLTTIKTRIMQTQPRLPV